MAKRKEVSCPWVCMKPTDDKGEFFAVWKNNKFWGHAKKVGSKFETKLDGVEFSNDTAGGLYREICTMVEKKFLAENA